MMYHFVQPTTAKQVC